MAGLLAPKAVVLGGFGFVGHHVCAALDRAGYDVLVVSRGRSPADPVAAGLAPHACPPRHLALDVSREEPAALADLLAAERACVVVNAAGGVWRVDDEQMLQSNVELVRRLVAAVAAAPSRPRLVQLGSLHEYGPVPTGASIDERTAVGPTTAYGKTKLHATQIVLEAAERGDIDAVVLRIANVAGPGAPPGSLLGFVCSQLVQAVRSGERATLRLAPLTSRRDFIDVRDTADAVVCATRAPGVRGVFNIGRGRAVSVRWLVTRLISLTAVAAEVREGQPDKSREGGAEWQRVDIRAARTQLGWQPHRHLEDTLREMWQTAARAAARTDAVRIGR